MKESKLAISNISWNAADDEKLIFSRLHQMSVTGIEIAPTKVWGDVKDVTDSAVISYRDKLNDDGFCIPAMQSIFYGHPEFQIFDNKTHEAMFEHLKKIFNICKLLGCKVAVFGCPKNRCYDANSMDANEAYKVAAEVFNKIGTIADSFGCVVGLEANPSAYKCNFLNNVSEVNRFVKMVASNGVKTHFDVGACVMNDEDACQKILETGDFCHFHVSTSYLENIADSVVDYKKMFEALDAVNYKNWVSIEMKQKDPSLYNIERALKALV